MYSQPVVLNAAKNAPQKPSPAGILRKRLIVLGIERIELAKKMGIEPFDFSFEVDGVFMTSGADKAIDTALKAVRAGGKILVFSSTPLNNGYPNNEIYYKELTVLGSYSPSPADLKDSFDLLASGKVNVKGLTTVYPLDKIQQAFDDTVANKIFKAYIKIAG